MFRGTTPTFKLTISDNNVDLTQAYNVYATFKQLSTVITKTGEDITISPQEVDIYLTQEESLQFSSGTLQIQLNWTYADGSRACSIIVSINVENNLIGDVLE